jgi:ribulose-phosphate 3-epimerase
LSFKWSFANFFAKKEPPITIGSYLSDFIQIAQSMANTMKIYPSLLAADPLSLAQELDLIQSADGIHLDIMDGCFVPNISFGADYVKSVKKYAPHAFLDCHLMVQNTGFWVERFIEIGVHQICLHAEQPDVLFLLKQIQKAGIKAAIALNPQTPAQAALSFLPYLNSVLIMSVPAGKGGQTFIPSVLSKIAAFQKSALEITVDGGIHLQNIASVAKAGAHAVVVGSAIFQSPQKKTALTALRQAIT